MDIKVKDKYVLILDKKGKTLLAQKITGRIETQQTVKTYDTITAVPVAKLPILKDDEQQEDNKLYQKNGKIVIKEVVPVPIKKIIKG